MGIEAPVDFEQNTLTQGDKLATRDMKGLPLLVYVVKRLEGLNTKHGNNKPGLIVDVLDLSKATDNVYTHVLWMNNQIIDNLSKYEGKAVPIRIEERHSNKTGNDYLLPVALEGQERETANAWAAARPAIFDDDRAAKGYPSVAEVQGGMGTGVTMGKDNSAAPAPTAAPANTAPVAAPVAPPAPTPAPAPAAPAPAAPAPVAAPVAAPAAPVAAPAPAAPPQSAAAPAPVAAPVDDNLPFKVKGHPMQEAGIIYRGPGLLL